MPLRSYRGPLLDGSTQPPQDPNPKVQVPEGMVLPTREEAQEVPVQDAMAAATQHGGRIPDPALYLAALQATRMAEATQTFSLLVKQDEAQVYHAIISHKQGAANGQGDAAEAAVLDAFAKLWAEVSRRCHACGQLLPEEGK